MYRRDSDSCVPENLWGSDVKVKNVTENESFNIVWRITNFTMCKLEKGKFFESPTFVAECLQNTKWNLRLYPRGDVDNDDVLCYLIRGNSSPDIISVRYKLSIGVTNECIDEIHPFDKDARSPIPAHGNRNEILDEVRKYPLVDILLIDCHIWNWQMTKKEPTSDLKSMASYLHNHEYNADIFPPEMLHSTLYEIEALKRKLRPYPGSCSAYTRIPVQRWYFLWTIKKFSERKPYEKETITVVSVSESAPKILMTFFVNEEGYLEMNIRELTGKYESIFTVSCQIQLVGIQKRNFVCFQDMIMLHDDEIWKVPSHLTQTYIVEKMGSFLSDDELTFRCELGISYENEVSNIDSCSYVPSDVPGDYDRSIAKYSYPKSAWAHMKFASAICVISFLIAFMYDALTSMYW